MSQTARRIFFFTFAAAALFLLSASLSSLRLVMIDPVPLPAMPYRESFSVAPMLPIGMAIYYLMMTFLALGLISLPIYLFLALRSRHGRRDIMTRTLGILINALIILFVIYLMMRPYFAPEDYSRISPFTWEGLGRSQPPETQSGLWIILVLSAAAALLVTWAVFWIYNRLAAARLPADLTPEQLALQAKQALSSLQSGEDVRSVVIRCYEGMSQILEKEKHITRAAAMTPQEFVRLLVQKGLPQAPIKTLTHLFEDVRYGNRPTGKREEDLALLSLSEIAAYCKPES
jgi:hypothetical protein